MIESVYFTGITITTVGYGDVAPDTDLGRAIVILYIWVGIGLITYSVSIIWGWAMTTSDTTDTGHTIYTNRSVSVGAVTGTSSRDKFLVKLLTYFEIPYEDGIPAFAKLIFSVVLVLLPGGTFFFYFHQPEWTFVMAFYWATCTLSSVGYGDLDYFPKEDRMALWTFTNGTQAVNSSSSLVSFNGTLENWDAEGTWTCDHGSAFACWDSTNNWLYIFSTVYAVAGASLTVTAVGSFIAFWQRNMCERRIEQLRDVDANIRYLWKVMENDEHEVGKLQFYIHMMKAMEKIDHHDEALIEKAWKMLDVNGDGKIDRNDLHEQSAASFHHLVHTSTAPPPRVSSLTGRLFKLSTLDEAGVDAVQEHRDQSASFHAI